MSRDLAASGIHTPTQNHLLAALPAADYERLLPDLELTALPLAMAVYESGGKLDYVYFPIDCIVSLLYVMKDGASTEIAVVGHDGLVGIALFMGGESTPSRAVVQSAGAAYRLSSKILKREFEHSGPLQTASARVRRDRPSRRVCSLSAEAPARVPIDHAPMIARK